MKNRHTPLVALDLSTRAFNGLTNAGYVTIGDVANASDVDLLRLRNFGRTSLRQVRAVQRDYVEAEDMDILAILNGYLRRYEGHPYVSLQAAHLVMAILEIESLRGAHIEQS